MRDLQPLIAECAKVSRLAYSNDPDCEKYSGLSITDEETDTQCFVFENGACLTFTFRGTSSLEDED